jgi:hypothetical protein
MLPYPSPQKRIPRPVAIATNYDEQANTVTLQIIWDTPRVPLYRYNGGYFISEEPIENVAALTEQQWAAMATPLPDSNGTTWVCLCKQWDGSNWVPIPEWIMYGGMWYMINYFRDSFSALTLHRLNLNTTVAVVTTVGRDFLFAQHDPVTA